MSLSKACTLFSLCRQGMYQQQRRDHRLRADLAKVKQLVADVRRLMPRLGTRKIYYLIRKELARKAIKLGRDRLFGFLKREGLLITPRKSYTKTTWSKHWMKKYPNTFKTIQLSRPEQAWVSDITYIPSRQGIRYLSLVTDAFSHKIVGYHLSTDLRAESVAEALKMAIKSRTTFLPLLHHSDRGVQYCSFIYQQLLKNHKIEPSMTEGAQNCYQNALAERINGIIKDEFLPEQVPNSHDIDQLIHEAVEIYNNKRPHLSLNYQTPAYFHQLNNKKTVNVF